MDSSYLIFHPRTPKFASDSWLCTITLSHFVLSYFQRKRYSWFLGSLGHTQRKHNLQVHSLALACYSANAKNISTPSTQLVLEASTALLSFSCLGEFCIRAFDPHSDFYIFEQLLIGNPRLLISICASGPMTIEGPWYEAGSVRIIFPIINATENNQLFHLTQILIIK